MYLVEYKDISEIIEQYTLVGKTWEAFDFYECVLVNCDRPVAIGIKSDINTDCFAKKGLKQVVRCYIIDADKDNQDMLLSILIDRYG